MAIGELLGAIEREALAERETIGADARAEADRLLAAAARRRAGDLSEAVARFRADQQRDGDRVLAAGRRRWQAEVLAARAAALDRLRVALVAALPAVLDDTLLDTLVAAALDVIGGDAATVRCPPALADRVRARLAARPDLRVVGDAGVGSGVHAELAGGLLVDATLEAFLVRVWPQLRQQALPGSAEVAS